jgi:hypothetical protein
MLRTTLIALAATVGMVAAPELATSTAQAGTFISLGIYAPFGHRHYRPVVVAPVVATPPVVYAPAAPVVVTPVCTSYNVLIRPVQTAPWQLYATYPNYSAAQAAVPTLQASGMWVMVEQR